MALPELGVVAAAGPCASGAPAPAAAGFSELCELRQRFVAWLKATNYSAVTVRNAERDLGSLFAFLAEKGIERAADVTEEVMRDYGERLRTRKSLYHKDRGLSVGHVVHLLNGAKSFFRWLTKESIVLYDPTADLEIPKLPQRLPKTILTQSEVKRLFAACDLSSELGYRDRALIEFLYGTGLRTAELLSVKVDDVNFEAKCVFVRRGKGGKDRLVPLPAAALAYVREYVSKIRPVWAKRLAKDDETLWLGPYHAKLNVNTMLAALNREAKRAGIEKRITAMTMRHTVASHMLENGMDIRYIQEYLGHEVLDSTQIYTRVTLSGLRRWYNKTHPRERRLRRLEDA